MAAICTAPGVAHAQKPSAADRATARNLAQEGYAALREEQFATAVDRFTRANALVHAPTLLRDLARAQIGLGRLVDANETYNQIIREGAPANAPASWRGAVEDAKQEGAALAARVPWLTIRVTGAEDPRVTLDGAPVEGVSPSAKRAVDPGSHEIRATAEGFEPLKKVVLLKEGDDLDVALELQKRAEPAAPPPLAKAPAAPAKSQAPKAPGWHKPATVGAFAIGGAGLVVGSVTGILAMTKHSELTSGCAEGTCGPDQESNYNDFHTLGTVSTISFAVGGVGVVSGVVLLLIEPRASARRETALVADKPGFRWSPFVGVGAAGVKGSF